MPVETRRFDSVDAFLDVAGPFLEAREPEHQLTLGIAANSQTTGLFPADGVLMAALSDGRVVATALWTPPWNLILSEVDDPEAIDAIAEAVAGEVLGGVHAPDEHAEAFARAWTERSGMRYRVAMRHGVSRLHSGRRHTLGLIFHDAA